jgi:tRNA U34 5-methylaminomethyl-2-thiouridine-forming methyltransferase MnmC
VETNQNNVELRLTEDGSHSLLNCNLNELYHSKHGAIQESMHVFIKMGLHKKLTLRPSVSILEIGFGTGLNAFLTLLENKLSSLQIFYTALEAYPIPKEKIQELNYATILSAENIFLFQKIHSCEWEMKTEITVNFSLTKIKSKLESAINLPNVDLIYFDAFSPAVQPELWTEEIFSKLFKCLKPEGILVTYSAKGEVKRNLKKAGYVVEGVSGPPGKREMTIATKLS